MFTKTIQHFFTVDRNEGIRMDEFEFLLKILDACGTGTIVQFLSELNNTIDAKDADIERLRGDAAMMAKALDEASHKAQVQASEIERLRGQIETKNDEISVLRMLVIETAEWNWLKDIEYIPQKLRDDIKALRDARKEE